MEFNETLPAHDKKVRDPQMFSMATEPHAPLGAQLVYEWAYKGGTVQMYGTKGPADQDDGHPHLWWTYYHVDDCMLFLDIAEPALEPHRSCVEEFIDERVTA